MVELSLTEAEKGQQLPLQGAEWKFAMGVCNGSLQWKFAMVAGNGSIVYKSHG